MRSASGVGFTGQHPGPLSSPRRGSKWSASKRGANRSTREDFAPCRAWRDDLKYAVRQELFPGTRSLRPCRCANTPGRDGRCRSAGSARFLPGVGGGAAPARALERPSPGGCCRPIINLRTHLENRYGKERDFPPRMTIEDFSGLLRRAGALLRSLREAARASSGKAGNLARARKDRRAATWFEGAAPERISQQAAGDEHGRRHHGEGPPATLGYHPFRGARRQT